MPVSLTTRLPSNDPLLTEVHRVREGMVFVAMESDDLLTRTAQYQVQHLPGRARRRGTVIFRHEEEGSLRVPSRPLRAFSYGADDDDDEDEDDRTTQIPAEFAAAPPPFIITTECSDDDDSDDDRISRPRPPRRRTPNTLGEFPLERDGESSDESFEIWGHADREWPIFDEISARTRGLYPPASQAHGSRGLIISANPYARPNGNGLTLEEAQEASQLATQEAVRAVGGELMTPLAHFFIEKDKNKCTVRFDPPVSGRFLLLKMWSPHQDVHDRPPNIDIQAVVAKGFAGPRFSPAVELA